MKDKKDSMRSAFSTFKIDRLKCAKSSDIWILESSCFFQPSSLLCSVTSSGFMSGRLSPTRGITAQRTAHSAQFFPLDSVRSTNRANSCYPFSVDPQAQDVFCIRNKYKMQLTEVIIYRIIRWINQLCEKCIQERYWDMSVPIFKFSRSLLAMDLTFSLFRPR